MTQITSVKWIRQLKGVGSLTAAPYKVTLNIPQYELHHKPSRWKNKPFPKYWEIHSCRGCSLQVLYLHVFARIISESQHPSTQKINAAKWHFPELVRGETGTVPGAI